jgi:hypothetical protein
MENRKEEVANRVRREPTKIMWVRNNGVPGSNASLVDFGFHITCNKLEDLNKILSQEYSDLKLAPVLDYVKKLTLTPSELNLEDVKKVTDAGYSEDELKDAITVCAAFNMFNRIVEGHGVEENSNTWDMSAEMINKYGYDRSKSQE